MRVVDRSRIESWFRCPRQRYYSTEFNGRGLVRSGPTPIDLAYGLGFHMCADDIIGGKPWREAFDQHRHQLDSQTGLTVDGLAVKDEYTALLYGHVRAFAETQAPLILSRYEILVKETEMVLMLSPDLAYLARPDLGVRDKTTGFCMNFEYKTDSNPSDIYGKMEFHLQMMLESAILEEHLRGLGDKDARVEGSIVLGIDKGFKRGPTEADKKLNHTSGERRITPFTYAYTRGAGDWSIDYKSGKGWARVPVFADYSHDAWWDILLTLGWDPGMMFVKTEPISFDPGKWKSVQRQIVAIEARIADGTALQASGKFPQLKLDAMDDYFAQNFSNCKNDGGYGRKCPWIDLCHFNGDPLSEEYTPRTANHPLEETLWTAVN